MVSGLHLTFHTDTFSSDHIRVLLQRVKGYRCSLNGWFHDLPTRGEFGIPSLETGYNSNDGIDQNAASSTIKSQFYKNDVWCDGIFITGTARVHVVNG